MPEQSTRHSIDKPLGNENVTRALYRALIDELDAVIPTAAEIRATGSANVASTATPTDLTTGITFDQVLASEGFPADGTLLVIKIDNDSVLQVLVDAGVSQMFVRHAASATTWHAWSGLPKLDGTNFYVGAASMAPIAARITGDAQDRYAQFVDGRQEWGPGSAARDVHMARSGADTLRLEDRLEAADGFVEDEHSQGNQGAAWTPDCRNGTTQRVTLTANITINAPTNAPASGKVIALTLLLKQDATGSRVVTWAAPIKWPAGVAPTLTITPGRTDVISLVSHDGGATWLGFIAGRDYNY